MCSSDGVWLVMRRVILAGPCAAADNAAVRCLWTVNTACKTRDACRHINDLFSKPRWVRGVRTVSWSLGVLLQAY
jgi:hypothetical protein